MCRFWDLKNEQIYSILILSSLIPLRTGMEERKYDYKIKGVKLKPYSIEFELEVSVKHMTIFLFKNKTNYFLGLSNEKTLKQRLIQ